METIFAVSSGAAPSAIAVLRISGPGAIAAASALCGGALPPPRRAGLRSLCDPADGSLLDRALVLSFPGPNSSTGEDLAELHLHGGRATIRAVEAALSAMPGLHPAEPGEFTRRALLNGRIDLTEAEGLGDLLAAETESQRRAALRTAEGGLRRTVEAWNDRLVAVAARIEAAIDFSDEDDVPADITSGQGEVIAVLAAEIDALLAVPPIERLRDGIRVVIAGPPNSGKSTLINRLADRDVAIVSSVAGTTRDRIEAPVMRGGVAYVLTDTAGLHDATDEIEQIGILRAEKSMRTGDILLWLDDTGPPMDHAIWLHARCDDPNRLAMPAGPSLAVSGVTGAGVGELWSILAARGATLTALPDGIATNARQRSLLVAASQALGEGAVSSDVVLMAEAIRSARVAFDAMTGRASTEAVLDALFGQFCIGK